MMLPWCVQVSDVPQQLMELGIKSTSCQPMLLQKLPRLQREMQASSRKLAALEAEQRPGLLPGPAGQHQTAGAAGHQALRGETGSRRSDCCKGEHGALRHTHPLSAADTAWAQPSISSLRD